MPQQDERRGEMQHRQEVVGVPFPADDQPSIVVEPREEPFDFPASLAAPKRTAILRGDLAIAAVPRDQFDPEGVEQMPVEGIAIVPTITDQPFRERREEAVVERGVDEADFRGRSAGHVDGERKTMAVADRHDLAAFAPARRADFAAPFFALAKVASMKPSVRSSLPRNRRSSARHSSRSRKTPVRCHC
jgi:hypothetical protein